MVMEVGDYFVIRRGVRIHPMMAGVVGVNVELPKLYDPSWVEVVLQAQEISGQIVCAEIVGLGAGAMEVPQRQIGTRHVIDLTKVQWEPVSKRFASLLSRPLAGAGVHGPACQGIPSGTGLPWTLKPSDARRDGE